MHNVMNSANFLNKLIEVNEALYYIFELSREELLEPVAEDGCVLYFEDTGKCCFQVAGQYKRPGEFLDALLDIIRVTYDPSPMGTLFLNSNPAFIYDAIPKVPFTLGYLSVVGAPEESFTSMWQGIIAEKLAASSYDLNEASSVFIVVAGGDNLFDLTTEVHNVTSAGFKVNEVLGLYAADLGFTQEKSKKKTYAGFVRDNGLIDRIRVSMWLVINHKETGNKSMRN